MKARQETFLHSVGFGTLWRLLSKVLSLIKHIVIAGAIGLSLQLDIFYMILAILGVFVFSWGSVLEIAAVPRLVELYKNKQYDVFRQLTGGLFWLALIGSAALTIIIITIPDYLAKIAIGFNKDKAQTLTSAFYWFAPATLLFVTSCFMGGIMRATRQFSHNYKSDFLGLFVILVCILLYSTDKNVLFWSFSLSCISIFLYLFVFSYKYIQFNTNLLSYEVKQCLKFSLSLLVLQSANYLYTIADRIFISFLETGAISALSYGMVLISLAPAILNLNQSFITVLSEKSSKAQKSKVLNNAISLSIYIAVPISIILLNFRVEIVQFLLERGAFNHQNTLAVSRAMVGYIGLLLPLFFLPLLHQVFQVEKRIRLMVNRVIAGVISNIIFNSLFLFYFKLGILGIALATSISYWIMFIFSLYATRKINYQITWEAHIKWGLWLVIIFTIIPLLKHINPFDMLVVIELTIISIISLLLALGAGFFYPRATERELIKNNLAKILAKIK